MSEQLTSDYLIERLHQWGVRRIYGYPGDGINGIMGALNRNRDKVRFIQTRHEELAAFMASAHGKFTGETGVCLATSGPGAVHLLNGLYDAAKDNVPVVAIVGQQATSALGSDYQQEIDLTSLYKDVARHYVHMVLEPTGFRTQIDRAMRIAEAERTVTAVIIPNDLQEKPMIDPPPRKHGMTMTGVGYRRPRVVPEQRDLEAAAEVLNKGEKVAMLVGAGALGAGDEVAQAAEKLGCGVAKAMLGKCVVSDEPTWVTGSIGLLGTRPSSDMMRECDTLLMVGTSFPYAEFLPGPDQARGVQIDIKPRNLSLRYPMEVPLHGDSKATLDALLPMLDYKQNRDWREGIEKGMKEWWQVLEERAYEPADPINPQRVFWEMSSRLPDNCIVSSDSGSAANWFMRDLKVREGMMASNSGGLATMCPGVPYALSAKINHPDRCAVACVGDGAMQMLGNNGLITAAQLWSEWSDPRLVILVLNNQDLNQVTWEQRVMAGDPKFTVSQNLPRFNYARYAEDILGLRGIRVEEPDSIGGALDQAFSADRPCLVDAITDPEVPPIPPHITFQQAQGFLSSMVEGDPQRVDMAKQSMRDVMATWLPGVHK